MRTSISTRARLFKHQYSLNTVFSYFKCVHTIYFKCNFQFGGFALYIVGDRCGMSSRNLKKISNCLYASAFDQSVKNLPENNNSGSIALFNCSVTDKFKDRWCFIVFSIDVEFSVSPCQCTEFEQKKNKWRDISIKNLAAIGFPLCCWWECVQICGYIEFIQRKMTLNFILSVLIQP